MRKFLSDWIHSYLSNIPLHSILRIWTATRVLGTLVFVVCFISCENEIEYDNSNDKMQLVVSANIAAGQPVACYVNATTSTIGYTEKDTIREYYIDNNGDTVYERYPHTRQKKMYLPDAQVQMRINDGEWFNTAYDSQTRLYGATEILLPGDRVEMKAHHPDYGTASSTQVVPHPVKVNAVHTTDIYPEITPNGWVQFALDIEAYTGDMNSIIGIRIIDGSFTCRTTKQESHTEKYYNEKYNRYYTRHVYDTITVSDTVSLTSIYSKGDVWDLPVNYYAYGTKYYGANAPKYIYFYATELQQPKQIHLFADQNMPSNVIQRDSLQLQHLSISIDVFSSDYRLYMTSVYADAYLGIKLPTGESYNRDEDDGYTENYIEYIIEEITNLGDQEKVQIYTNVNGGLGCFAAYAPQSITIK